MDSVETGDAFFRLEHVVVVECGVLETGYILLKIYKTPNFFFLVLLALLIYEHLEKDSLGYAPD